MRDGIKGTIVLGLFVLWSTLVVLIAMVLTGCAPAPRPEALRGPKGQADTVVRVEMFCLVTDPYVTGVTITSGGTGSGVMISSDRVITAAHVTECSYLADVHVTTADSRRFPVRVDKIDRAADLVTLHVPVPVDPIMAPQIASPPRQGDEVWLRYAVPERGSTSGIVLGSDGDRVAHTALTRHGNSGGPVYDAEGHLVGIVTTLSPDLGGTFVSLDAHRDVIQ